MKKHKPLITRQTWKKVCDRYQDLLQAGLAVKERTPFLPIAEPGFGKPRALSIVFCGISVGEAPSTILEYSERVEELAPHFDYWLKAKPRSRTFWHDVTSVRDALLQSGHFPEVRVGWANILPINNNRGRASTQPGPALVDRQQDIAELVWQDLVSNSGADAIVATFGQRNFGVDKLYADGGGFLMDRQIWIRRAATREPAIVWANHANGRRGFEAPKAADIASALLSLLLPGR